MTATKRENILSALVSALAPAEGVSGRIYRGRPYPARVEETPCIFVTWVNDLPSYDNLNIMDWVLTFRVVIVTRDEAPDVAADGILNSVHSLLMADRTIGNTVHDVLPAEQRMSIIEGDNPVGLLEALYNVKYRTAQEAMT